MTGQQELVEQVVREVEKKLKESDPLRDRRRLSWERPDRR